MTVAVFVESNADQTGRIEHSNGVDFYCDHSGHVLILETFQMSPMKSRNSYRLQIAFQLTDFERNELVPFFVLVLLVHLHIRLLCEWKQCAFQRPRGKQNRHSTPTIHMPARIFSLKCYTVKFVHFVDPNKCGLSLRVDCHTDYLLAVDEELKIAGDIVPEKIVTVEN